jgi:hypothetical protein
MTARSYARGHPIYYDGMVWRYENHDSPYDDSRPCIKCNRLPTPEGYDACLGFVPGASAACCGHGVETPILICEE